MKVFKLRHLKTGKLYRLSDGEVLDFYNEQVFRRVNEGKPKLLDILRSLGNGGRMVSPFAVVGTALIRLFDPEGELKEAVIANNLVVTTGKEAVIDRLQAAGVAVHDYQAIGTGTNAAAAGDTTLQTENARAQGTLSQPNATTDRLVTSFAAGTGTGAITETGRLNASSNGNLFARLVFSAVNKGASDTLQVTHDITIS